MAYRSGDKEIVELLLKYSTNPNIVNNDGIDSLLATYQENNQVILKELLR